MIIVLFERNPAKLELDWHVKCLIWNNKKQNETKRNTKTKQKGHLKNKWCLALTPIIRRLCFSPVRS